MSDTVIEATGLTKRYGEAVAVNGISFTIQRGEIFGLLGPNGAGKTTTILMLLGLTEVSDGTVRVLGHDPVREPLAGGDERLRPHRDALALLTVRRRS